MFISLVTSMLIYPWMHVHLGPKLHRTLVASTFNINGMISSFNKFLSFYFFVFFKFRVFCSPLNMDGHASINLQKHTIFKQRSSMVNVLLLLHVGIAHFD
jgi:hypothetical protein